MAWRKAAALKPKAPPKPRAKKPKAVHIPKRHWTEAAGAGSVGAGAHAGHANLGTGHAGAAMSVLELTGAAGLSGVLLELVGEGTISLGHALSAWQLEQDRISNRAWRRPGGMARMGGV